MVFLLSVLGDDSNRRPLVDLLVEYDVAGIDKLSVSVLREPLATVVFLAVLHVLFIVRNLRVILLKFLADKMVVETDSGLEFINVHNNSPLTKKQSVGNFPLRVFSDFLLAI